MKLPIAALLVASLALRAPAAAGEETTAAPGAQTSSPGTPTAAVAPVTAEASRWRLGAAFGYGVRSNPLIQSDDIPIVVDLDIAWFGDHFFFDNGDLGLTFLDNEYVTTSVVGRLNSDRVFFGLTDTRYITIGNFAAAPLSTPDTLDNLEAVESISVPDRDFAGEIGVELLTDGRWGFAQATAFHDVTGTHEGYELAASYGYGWRDQRLYIEPSVGLSYKSAAMNDYYWGVRENELFPGSPRYEVGAGTNVYARLQVGYQINRNWSFSFVGEVERLNDAAADSPIVADQSIVAYFAGFGYRFR